MSTQYIRYPNNTGSSSSSSGGVTGSQLGVPYIVGPLNGAAASANGGVIGSYTLYFQSAGATFPGLVSSGTQTFSGVKTFNSAPNFNSLTANLPLQLDGSKNVVSQAIDLTVAGGDVVGSVSLVNQVSGTLSLTTQVNGILPVANGGSTGSNTGDVSVATIGASPNAQGASVAAGQVLTLQPADATFGGIVTATTQTFVGAKTFATSASSKTFIIGSVTLTENVGGGAYSQALPDAASTAGTILVGTASGVFYNFPKGAEGSVLTTDSTASIGIKWGSILNNWNAQTTSGSWLTNTIYTALYKRIGDTLYGQVYVLLQGAPTSATLSVQLPSGLNIDTTKLAGAITNNVWVGSGTISDTGNAEYGVDAMYIGSVSSLRLKSAMDGVAGGLLKANDSVNATTPITFGSSDFITYMYQVPIVGWV